MHIWWSLQFCRNVLRIELCEERTFTLGRDIYRLVFNVSIEFALLVHDLYATHFTQPDEMQL